MAFYNNVIAGAAGQSGGSGAGFKIERSLRFDDSADSNLSRTFSLGNQKKWTWSAWVKRSKLVSNNYLALFAAPAGSGNDGIFFRNDAISVSYGYAGSGIECYTSSVFRDPSAWYHIVVALDADQSTPADRLKIWVNNQLHTLNQYPGSGNTSGINAATLHHLGLWKNGGSTNYPFDGYLADVHFIDGLALAPTDFGEPHATTGVWTPIAYVGNYNGSGVGQVYSGMLTSSSGFGPTNTAAEAFDGSLQTKASTNHNTDNYLEFTPTTPIAFTNGVQVHCYAPNGYSITNYWSVDLTGNGLGSETSFVGGGSNYNGPAWITVATGSGTLYKLRIRLVRSGSNAGAAIHAIAINGSGTNSNYLVDGIPAGANGFRLDFSDNSSDAALGTDSSGNSNNWSVNNINAVTTATPTEPGTTYVDKNIGFYLNGNPPLLMTKDPDNTNLASNITHGMSTSATWAVNDVLQWAVDRDAGKVWIGRNDTWYASGNPSNGTNPGLENLSSSARLYLGKAYDSSNCQLEVPSTANYTPPTGFTYWNASSGQWVDSGTMTSAVQDDIFSLLVPSTGKIYIEAKLKGGLNLYQVIGLMNHGETFDYPDSLLDSPTNYEASSGNNGGNYCTLNPLDNESHTLSNGNLDITNFGSSRQTHTTILPSSGKWYAEFTFSAAPGDVQIGIANINGTGYGGSDSNSWGIISINGNLIHNNSQSSYGSSFTIGDTIMVALDLDNGKWYAGKNGTWFNSGNPANGTNPANTGLSGNIGFMVGSNAANGFVSCNFGARSFSHTPPTGFLSLCTTNLPNPTIANPSTAFDAKTWQGDGVSNARTISGYNFSPDFVWGKTRSAAYRHMLYDTVRGAGKDLRSDSTQVESTNDQYGYLSAFTSDGFTASPGSTDNDHWNHQSKTYVAWAWDGGDLATNSAYNQSQTWSSSLTSSGSFGNTGGALTAFDGNTTTLCQSAANTETLTFAPSGGISYSTSVEVYTYASHGQFTTTSDGAQTVSWTSTYQGWKTIASGGGTFTSTVLNSTSTGTATSRPTIAAIRVDGKLLVDAGLIPVGSLNSSVYDQSRTWSNDVSGTQYSASYAITKGFDNNLSTRAGGSYTFTPPNPIACTKVRIYMTTYAAPANTIYLNGVDISSEIPVTNGYAVPLEFTPSNNQFVSYQCGNAGNEPGWFAKIELKINGDWVALIDSGVTVDSVPSIASTVRANPSAGFSIVEGTLDSTNAVVTLGHGLNSTPEFIISKNREWADDWRMYHKDLGGNSKYLKFTNASVFTSGTNIWGNTSSVIGYNGALTVPSGASDSHIFYCFAPVEGYSAFGSYEGNGSSDGPFVFTGMRPAFILVKNADNADDWCIADTTRSSHNVQDETLFPNSNTAEDTGSFYIDVLSNGFKPRHSSGKWNSSGHTFIYAAFAEHPFKTARAR